MHKLGQRGAARVDRFTDATVAKQKANMTRGKLLFMFGGLCVVAILLWIAIAIRTPAPGTGARPLPLPATDLSTASGDFYVAGHVHHPGMFSLKAGETIKDAITDAGGADSLASELIVRLDRKEGGIMKTRSIPLPDALSGTSDEKVRLGDVIDVVQQVKPATLPVIPAVGSGATPAGGMQ